MKIEALTATVPDQLAELQIETSAISFVPDGVLVNHPLLLDVRNQEDLLLFRLHLTYEEAGKIGQTLQELNLDLATQ